MALGDEGQVVDDGHFYSVKAPGLALVATPAYKGSRPSAGTEASADLARHAREQRRIAMGARGNLEGPVLR